MSYTNQPPYTLTSIGSQLRERIMFAIEQETPECGPELPYKRHLQFPAQSSEGDDSDDGGQPSYQQIERTTDVQRWRSVYVRVSRAGRGDNSDGDNLRHYALSLNVVIGYPNEALIKFDIEDDTVVYDVEDLILHDTEQLVDVISGAGIFNAFNGEAEIGGVQNIEWLGNTRAGNVMNYSFMVYYERVR